MTGTDRNTIPGAGAETETSRTAATDATAEPATAEAAPAVAELQQRLAEAEEAGARLKDDYLRALAETENVRRRAARDRQEAGQYAVSNFARDLLSVADNLSRALASVDADTRHAEPALDALMSGVEMTEKELLAIFERNGIRPLAAAGELFDPHVHEALFELPDPSVPHGTVLQVMQSGYRIHDRTLRPARVGIARGGPKPGPKPAEAAAEDAEAMPLIAEDDGVMEFPQRDAYRKPGDDTVAGRRLDEET